MNEELKQAAETAAAKATLPVTVAAISIGGWGVAEWMYLATLLYVVLQGAYLLWKWRKEWLAHKAFKDAMMAPAEKAGP